VLPAGPAPAASAGAAAAAAHVPAARPVPVAAAVAGRCCIHRCWHGLAPVVTLHWKPPHLLLVTAVVLLQLLLLQ
jgi:hypothetical protein